MQHPEKILAIVGCCQASRRQLVAHTARNRVEVVSRDVEERGLRRQLFAQADYAHGRAPWEVRVVPHRLTVPARYVH